MFDEPRKGNRILVLMGSRAVAISIGALESVLIVERPPRPFLDAILGIKNAARNKQILSAPG